MSKHHWTSQKIITVRESIDDTKLTRIVHYITEDRIMVDRYKGRKGGFGSLSEKNYYEMKKRAEERANRKKPKVKENVSRVGVGTIDKKPKTKTPTTIGRGRNKTTNVNPTFGTKALDRFREKAKAQTEKNIQSGKDAAENQRNFFSRLFKRRGSQNPRGRNRVGMNAGGLVKKSKGIDGIAKRGKTRAARSR